MVGVEVGAVGRHFVTDGRTWVCNRGPQLFPRKRQFGDVAGFVFPRHRYDWFLTK